MNTVKVEKERLRETLEANRETHRKDFELAWEGYRVACIQNLESLLDAARDSRRARETRMVLNLQQPVDHTADYDQALRMLDWETGNKLVLQQHEFAELVMDDWSWKGQFATSNVLYTGSASPSSAGRRATR